MKGFICPHCKGSIQIPPYRDRIKVGLEMIEDGMSIVEAERLCGLGRGTLSKMLKRRREKPPLELCVVDWQNGKATKAIS